MTDVKQTAYGVTGRTMLAGIALGVLAAVLLLANPSGAGWVFAGVLSGMLIHAAILGHVIKGVIREVR